MHFDVSAEGAKVLFAYSDCGDSWSAASFLTGSEKSAFDDAARHRKVLDCLGRYRGGHWQITRDDLSAIEVIDVCRAVVYNPQHSTFVLTATVAREIAKLKGVFGFKIPTLQICEEVTRIYTANAMARGAA